MIPPTCKQLWNEECGDSIAHYADDSWRHGSYCEDIYHRKEDGTYWSASYRKSGDGETNEFREGDAIIQQVEPYTVTVTKYRLVKENEDA